MTFFLSLRFHSMVVCVVKKKKRRAKGCMPCQGCTRIWIPDTTITLPRGRPKYNFLFYPRVFVLSHTLEETALMCGCVFHSKPFFLPVYIQHNRCPCRFFKPTWRDTSSVATKHTPHRRTTLLPAHAGSTAADNAIVICHNTANDTILHMYGRHDIEYSSNR